MKKILFTILAAATMLTAGAQNATFTYFNYKGNDTRFDKKIDPTSQYLNPILAGFYPDPSFCRVGDKFYLVNSSFAFFPGVPIFESDDLVNWQQIGHVLDRPSQLPLDGQGVSRGIFAPDIKYNPKNKTYYMITTSMRMGNFFVKTKDPHAGWSDPIRLPQIDHRSSSIKTDRATLSTTDPLTAVPTMRDSVPFAFSVSTPRVTASWAHTARLCAAAPM